jgi:hypothetical protein
MGALRFGLDHDGVFAVLALTERLGSDAAELQVARALRFDVD